MNAAQETTRTAQSGALRAVAPAAQALIDDLVAHWVNLDPRDETGFGDRETWEWRLSHFGYVQLFTDWWTAVGEPRSTERQSEGSHV